MVTLRQATSPDWARRYGEYFKVEAPKHPVWRPQQDRLAGRQAEIHAARDRKLEEARKQRQIRRQKAA
ncbi:MAG: hypothetical protein WCD15_19015 [Terriglobales bacterium]